MLITRDAIDDPNENDSKLNIEAKCENETLWGRSNESFQVRLIVTDDSEMKLDEGETTMVAAELNKAIINTNGSVDYLIVTDVEELESDDIRSAQISTQKLASQSNSDRSRESPTDGLSRSEPSSSQNKIRIKRCTDCGKVIKAELLTNGLCQYCR